MSDEQINAFFAKVKANSSLQEKLRAATDIDAVAEIAKADGFPVSSEALQSAQLDISEEELKVIAGGWSGNAGFHFGNGAFGFGIGASGS